jgi:hypothetical protein
MIQKLKQALRIALLLSVLVMPVAVSGTGFAAGCPGTDAPNGANCNKIPLGCPGSLVQGPVDSTKAIKCPYKPTTAFTCKAKTCTFPDGSSMKNGESVGSDGQPNGNAGCVIGNEAVCATADGDCGNPANTCTDPATSKCQGTSTSTSDNCNLIKDYVDPFIGFLAALVGVSVVISIVIGGIQYGSSAGDSARVNAAKNRIRNSIIALIAFVFLFALLNFLIPGGI